jgi:hypothetical protein
MKRILAIAVLGAGALAALLSCASLPEPEGPDTALVIGSFTMAFPDGFFGGVPRTFTQGAKLYFANLRTSKSFSILSDSRGYFSFLSNGTDEYAFVGGEMKLNETGRQSSFGGRVMRRFPTVPGKVVYLGHFTLSFTHPQKTAKQANKAIIWNYEEVVDLEWRDEELQQYLAAKSPDSAWLQRELRRQASYELPTK